MKKWMTMLMITAAAAIAPVTANAGIVQATVEHDFVVAGKTMPAGIYLLNSDTSTGTATIRATEGKPAVMVLTRPQNNLDPVDAHLAFRLIDGKYYLVSYGALGAAYDLNNAPRPKGPAVLSKVKATVLP